MTTLIFVRHGESAAFDYIAGRTDVLLSEKGRKEAEATAAVLSKIKIDKLIASPIRRTMETAGYISKAANLEIEQMPDFMEIEFGDWTGKTFAELKNEKQWNQWNTFRSGSIVPNGESMLNVQNRVIAGVRKVMDKYPDKTVTIVSHGDPIRCVVLYYLGMPLDMVLRIKINTASISIIKISETGAWLHCYNYTPDLKWLDI